MLLNDKLIVNNMIQQERIFMLFHQKI